MRKAPSRKPLEIKISTVVAVAAILHDTDPEVLDRALRDVTGGEADYFEDEFAVIDLAGLDQPDHTIDWPALLAVFKSYRLNPVAVRNAPAALEPELRALGLSVDHVRSQPAEAQEASAPAAQADLALQAAQVPAAVTSADATPPIAQINVPAAASAAPPAAQAEPATARPTMIIDTPVRSGQRIYARGSDLIVTAVVNNSAELIADGSIHVYAPLRGRALAGASGDATARIFTLGMEAELVSIAGIYRTFDDALPRSLAGHAAEIRLHGDRIDVKPIAEAGAVPGSGKAAGKK